VSNYKFFFKAEILRWRMEFKGWRNGWRMIEVMDED
jgi:hypothetical protein